MPSTKTQIAYFDPLGVYRELCDELKSKLPLVNLHWNPPSRPLRSIPTLDVDLVEEEAVTHSTPKHQMLGLSSAPYLKLIFIKCDDNETYRQSIRTMIREWLTNNVNGTRDPTEWLIIHYVPTGGKSSSANRFKSTVFDKIRADFNSGSKKDRCVQIRKDFSSEMEYMETWSDAMTRIKEAVLDAFGKRVDLYEDEVNKLEAKKNVMGWNFGTFFIMKEGLALSFENISLYEDALMLYDELETAFGTMSRQKSVASFLSSIGFDYEKNPPSSLMNIQDDSQWRHQIMSNAISLFDFHCYLFSRQAHLMLQIAKTSSSASISALKIGELYLRLRTFLTEMNGLLLSNKKNMFMVAEWSYNVIKEFLEATADTQDGLVRQVAEGRGELMLLSRKSLETLARNKEYNIEGALSEVSLHEDSVMGEYHVQTKELEEYLKDDMSFYQQYRSVTIAASAEFELADRIRTVNRLSAQLALLDYQLGNYETACSQLENIPTLYGRQGWDIISASLLSVYIKCLMKLDRKEDILTNSLELLRQHKHLGKAEVDELIDNVQTLCDSFESKASLDTLFEATVVPYVSVNATGKYTIKVIISSNLTKDFPLEDATLTLHNVKSAKEKLVFRNESPLLVKSDRVELEFTCNKFIRGQFQVVDLKMSKGKLLLSKEFNNDPDPTIVDFYPSPHGFWAKLKAPKIFALPERRLILQINAPKQVHVENCKVSFKPITPGLKIQTQKADTKEATPGGLTIGEFDESTEVSVPFVADAEVQRIAVRTVIDFTTSSGIFQHIFVDDIDAILAIDVNVHDFFKTHKFFSKFSVSCKTHEPVRVFNGSLQSTDHYKVSPPVDTGPTIVFPGGPVSQVFAITKETGQNQDETLLLTIQHCYVREECLTLIRDSVQAKLKEKGLESYKLLVEPLIKWLPINVKFYALEGVLRIPNDVIHQVEETKYLDYIRPSDRKAIVRILSDCLRKEYDDDISDFDAISHELRIPVPIPTVDMVHEVELLFPESDHFVIGRTIPVTMKINSTDVWSGLKENPDDKNTHFMYDIIPNDSWTLSGKKRGSFDTTTPTHEFKISLVPLRTGKLSIPRVEIYVRGGDSSLKMEVDHKNGGENALVVPEFDRISVSF